mmetsp:Transcript_60750/g.143538  ORF Transcript_60750/g.143538 Transcript_60750/m.143538 type:complete len:239 (-) Transcript_60750:388-1104(-)
MAACRRNTADAGGGAAQVAACITRPRAGERRLHRCETGSSGGGDSETNRGVVVPSGASRTWPTTPTRRRDTRTRCALDVGQRRRSERLHTSHHRPHAPGTVDGTVKLFRSGRHNVDAGCLATPETTTAPTHTTTGRDRGGGSVGECGYRRGCGRVGNALLPHARRSHTRRRFDHVGAARVVGWSDLEHSRCTARRNTFRTSQPHRHVQGGKACCMSTAAHRSDASQPEWSLSPFSRWL